MYRPRPCLMLAASLPLSAFARDTTGTPEQRDQLFHELRTEILEREAFSPVKEDHLGLDVPAAMDAIEPEVTAAETDTELFYALVKLSNARKDRHLEVVPAEGGLEVSGYEDERAAPLRFATDYGAPGAYTIFVADLDASFFAGGAYARTPAIGDRVVSVDGRPLADHVAAVEPYLRYSTVENLWWHVSDELGERSAVLPPDHYGDTVTYGLEAPDGAAYEVTVPWLASDDLAWTRPEAPVYPDLALELTTETFELYRHTAGREVVVLRWLGFKETLLDDVETLTTWAADHGLLGHALIVDATGSRGGSYGADALSHLTGTPFRCTFGNLRLSDVTEPFVAQVREEVEAGDESQEELLAWLEGPVTEALAEGRAYSDDVPFKLQTLPADSDGIVQPAPVHFEGPLVAFFGPQGGSHLDQFAAMIIDNRLGHTIGLPTGGYSNTWEWTETVELPGEGRPLVDFMWSIGQTIRPNGEVLEGNPAQVGDRFPPTAENHERYHALLLERAYAWLDGRPPDSP